VKAGAVTGTCKGHHRALEFRAFLDQPRLPAAPSPAFSTAANEFAAPVIGTPPAAAPPRRSSAWRSRC
jgi:hypothetical protein